MITYKVIILLLFCMSLLEQISFANNLNYTHHSHCCHRAYRHHHHKNLQSREAPLVLLDSEKSGDTSNDGEIISCPEKLALCTCIKSNVGLLINCTNTNYNDSSVLHSVPESTHTLIFKGNNINELPVNVFGEKKGIHDNLRLLDLSDNRIETIHGKSLHDVNGVRKLIINNNRIDMSEGKFHSRFLSNFESLEELYLSSAFSSAPNFTILFAESHLTNLRILDLSHNSITHLTQFTFCPLPNLTKLFLHHNQLKTIPDISCNPRFRTLDVSYCDFNNVPIDRLVNLTRSFHINLIGNPFDCDCHLSLFANWLKQTPLFVLNKNNYTCIDGRTLLSLEENDFICHQKTWSRGWILWFSIGFCILLLILIFRRRKSAYAYLENEKREVEEVAV